MKIKLVNMLLVWCDTDCDFGLEDTIEYSCKGMEEKSVRTMVYINK